MHNIHASNQHAAVSQALVQAMKYLLPTLLLLFAAYEYSHALFLVVSLGAMATLAFVGRLERFGGHANAHAEQSPKAVDGGIDARIDHRDNAAPQKKARADFDGGIARRA